MLKAEKKSLFQFVALFVILNFVFLTISSIFYFKYQKNIYLDFNEKTMALYAKRVANKTIDSKNLDDLISKIPIDTRFSVIFIAKDTIIYNTSMHKEIDFKDGFFEFEQYLQYAQPIQMRHLKKIDYIVVHRDGLTKELNETKDSILIFWLFAFIFISIGTILLSRLFLRPLRDYIQKLDKFIQDTTHELNTPLSVILMSIQRMNTDNLDDKNKKHLQRISVASKTISTLYNDLTFLVQQKALQDNIEEFNIAPLMKERISYFKELADAKNITIKEYLNDVILKIDKTKLTRIVDNLLSNAIKYNKRNGTIDVFLDDKSLKIKDTGIGIKEDEIEDAFKLYTRLDQANGGFGIGLNLIKLICDEYKFQIKVNSKLGIGTTFEIIFI